MAGELSIFNRFGWIVAGSLCVAATFFLTTWLDGLGIVWMGVINLALFITGCIIIPSLILSRISIGELTKRARAVIIAVVSFLLLVVWAISPDGIELFGEILDNIGVEEATGHPRAFAFTFRDAELRAEFQGEGEIRHTHNDRIHIDGKAYVIPVVSHSWQSTMPVRVWLIASHGRDDRSATVLWPATVTSVVRTGFNGGGPGFRSAVQDAVYKYSLSTTDEFIFVQATNDLHGAQANRWESFYACVQLAAGIWFVAGLVTWLTAWTKSRRKLRKSGF